MTTLGVGNLPFGASEDSVRALFACHGVVEAVALVTERHTGQPRGYGTVQMSPADARQAIEHLNGQLCEGRVLKVYETGALARAAGAPRRR